MARAPNMGHFLLHPPPPQLFPTYILFSNDTLSLPQSTILLAGPSHWRGPPFEQCFPHPSIIFSPIPVLYRFLVPCVCFNFLSFIFRHDLAFSPPLFHPSPLFPHPSLFQSPRCFRPPPTSVLLPSPPARLALSLAPALHIPCPFFLFPHLRPGTFRHPYIPETPGCCE